MLLTTDRWGPERLSDEQKRLRGAARAAYYFEPKRSLNEAIAAAGYKSYDAEVGAFIDAYLKKGDAYDAFYAAWVEPQEWQFALEMRRAVEQHIKTISDDEIARLENRLTLPM